MVVERHGRQARLAFEYEHQRAPVETLHGDLREYLRSVDLVEQDVDELFPRGGLLRGARLDLGLDVQGDVVGAVPVDQVEDLAEQRMRNPGFGTGRGPRSCGTCESWMLLFRCRRTRRERRLHPISARMT